MEEVKLYLDLEKEDIHKLQEEINFQHISRRIFRMLKTARDNNISIKDFIDSCNYLLEKKFIKDKKSVFNEI